MLRRWILASLGLLVGGFLLLQLGQSVTKDFAEERAQLTQQFQAKENALNQKVSALNLDLGKTRVDLQAEVARKKELAVLYERAEAARKQAVADHAVLAAKLRGLEAKQKSSRR